jgi:RNAse (barnase) inhibitor barstar
VNPLTTLSKILANPQRCGVFRFSGETGKIESAAWAAGLASYKLDMGSAHNKIDLLDAFAATLKFPDYFGRNWDALDECLSDLAWIDAPGWVLTIENSTQVAVNNQETLATAIQVLQSAAEYWQGEGKSFWAILLDDGKARLPELPQLPEK